MDPSSEEQGQGSEEHLDKTQECKPSGHKNLLMNSLKLHYNLQDLLQYYVDFVVEF
jgi:hypothetical protein